MRRAISKHGEVTAGPDAPENGYCQDCGHPVVLVCTGNRKPYYRHLEDAPRSCPHTDTKERVEHVTGWYALSLEFIRITLKDALDGYGEEELTALWQPIAQYGLYRLCDGADPDRIARSICERILALDDDERAAAHHAIKWGSWDQLAEVFDGKITAAS
jgi:hypothetical protein